MTIDHNAPAIPFTQRHHGVDGIYDVHLGLTIRAELAARAMQGMLSNGIHCTAGADTITNEAIKYADALIAELNKPAAKKEQEHEYRGS